MKTLAETRAKILEEAEGSLSRRINTFQNPEHFCKLGQLCELNTLTEDVMSVLSTALDTMWEDFKGVVEMERLNSIDPFFSKGGIEHGFEHAYNKAIDELQSRIKSYERR